MWRLISFPPPLMGSVHILPHTPASLESNMHRYRQKYGYLCVDMHLCVPVCKRICVYRVCCGGMWGVYGWCCRYQDKLALIPVLQRETDTRKLLTQCHKKCDR